MNRIGVTYLTFLAFLFSTTTLSISSSEIKPQEMYKKLSDAYVTAWTRLDTDNNDDPSLLEKNDCSATPEQTIAWFYLRKLFSLYDSEVAGGIMKQVWPRPTFYNKVFHEILKPDSTFTNLGKTRLCTWNITNPNRLRSYYFICHEGQCRRCGKDHKIINKTSPAGDGDGDPRNYLSGLDDKLKAMCDGQMEKAPVNIENQTLLDQVGKELSKAPEVTSPGSVSLDEILDWASRLKSQKSVLLDPRRKTCNAPPKLTLSLSYVRNLALQNPRMVSSREEIHSQMKSHPEFYTEKLKWLKGADLSTIVPCRHGRVCAWDGACQLCEIYGKEGLDPNLKEACGVDWPRFAPIQIIEDWEMENVLSPTSWNSPQEALATWIQVFQKFDKNTVNKVGGKCSASEELSGSWSSLKSLVEDYEVSGILKYAWPRITQVDKKLELILKNGAGANRVIFCGKTPDKGETAADWFMPLI